MQIFSIKVHIRRNKSPGFFFQHVSFTDLYKKDMGTKVYLIYLKKPKTSQMRQYFGKIGKIR